MRRIWEGNDSLSTNYAQSVRGKGTFHHLVDATLGMELPLAINPGYPAAAGQIIGCNRVLDHVYFP